jgi:hypothetical protein
VCVCVYVCAYLSSKALSSRRRPFIVYVTRTFQFHVCVCVCVCLIACFFVDEVPKGASLDVSLTILGEKFHTLKEEGGGPVCVCVCVCV